MREAWRVVPVHRLTARRRISSFHKYEASSCGRIKKDGVLIGSQSLRGGYKTVYVNGYGFGIHRLVALAFHHRSRTSFVVNHKNLLKWDNRASNLEWVTQSEDACHSRGRRPGSAKGLKSPRHGAKKVAYVSAYVLHQQYLKGKAK